MGRPGLSGEALPYRKQGWMGSVWGREMWPRPFRAGEGPSEARWSMSQLHLPVCGPVLLPTDGALSSPWLPEVSGDGLSLPSPKQCC